VTEVGVESFVLIAEDGATDQRAFVGCLREAWRAGAEP
jgi:hypothetical protein